MKVNFHPIFLQIKMEYGQIGSNKNKKRKENENKRIN